MSTFVMEVPNVLNRSVADHTLTSAVRHAFLKDGVKRFSKSCYGVGDGGLERLLSESRLAVRRSTSARLRGLCESPRAR